MLQRCSASQFYFGPPASHPQSPRVGTFRATPCKYMMALPAQQDILPRQVRHGREHSLPPRAEVGPSTLAAGNDGRRTDKRPTRPARRQYAAAPGSVQAPHSSRAARPNTTRSACPRSMLGSRPASLLAQAPPGPQHALPCSTGDTLSSSSATACRNSTETCHGTEKNAPDRAFSLPSPVGTGCPARIVPPCLEPSNDICRQQTRWETSQTDRGSKLAAPPVPLYWTLPQTSKSRRRRSTSTCPDSRVRYVTPIVRPFANARPGSFHPSRHDTPTATKRCAWHTFPERVASVAKVGLTPSSTRPNCMQTEMSRLPRFPHL